MATLLPLAAFGAGAAALVTGSTGVPEVDRLLGIVDRGLDEPGAPDDPGRGRLPSPGPAAVPVAAPLGQSGRRVVSTAYVAEDGKVCWAATRADGERDEGLGVVSCFEAASLDARLMQSGGMWVVNVDEAVVVHGLLRGDVVSLRGQGPNGPLAIYLGKAWRPDLSEARAMRPFLAIGDASFGEGTQADALDRLTDRNAYVLKGQLVDGSTIAITP
jgi:hypothetical protein